MEIESYRDGMSDSMVIDEDNSSDMSFQQPQQTKKRSKKKRESPMDSMMVSWKLGRQPIPPDIAAYTENIRRQNLLENDDEEVDMYMRNNNSSNNSSSESLYLINNIHNSYQESMTKIPNHEVNVSHNKPLIPKLDFNSSKFLSNHLNNNSNSNNEQSNNMMNSASGNQSNMNSGNSEKLPSVHELLPGWVPTTSTNTSPNQSPRTFSVTSPVSSTTTSPRGNIQSQSPLTSPLNSSYSQQSNLNYTSYSPRIPPAPSPILSSGNLPLSSPHGYSSFGLSSPHQIPHSPNTTSQNQTQLLYTSSPNDSPRLLTPTTVKKGPLHNTLSPLSSPRISSPHYSESLLSINHSHTTSTNSVSLEDLMRMKLGQN